MVNDSLVCYFNNLYTYIQLKKHAIDCSTGTEDPETESVKSNGQCTKCIYNSTNRKIPISIHCMTVNFHSDTNIHLAFSDLTASSPEGSKTSNPIVSPTTNIKKTKSNSALNTIDAPIIPPILDNINSSAKEDLTEHKCYDVLQTRMLFNPKFVHWHYKTSTFA